jgi:hypothetical protein
MLALWIQSIQDIERRDDPDQALVVIDHKEPVDAPLHQLIHNLKNRRCHSHRVDDGVHDVADERNVDR